MRRLAAAAKTIAARPYPIHLFPPPPSAVRRVIFGARVPAASRDQLIARTRAAPPFRHVEFAQATLDPRRFRVEIGDVPTPAEGRARRRGAGGRPEPAAPGGTP